MASKSKDSTKSSPNDTLTVAVGQLTSVDNWNTNEEQIFSLLAKIQNPSDVDLICFPENSLYMRLDEGAPLDYEHEFGKGFDKLSEYAQKYQLTIHLGSVPMLIDEKPYNSSVILKPNGNRRASYQKIHLFDVEIAGHRSYRESDTVTHGQKTETFDMGEWKIGQSICYDLRFPELFLKYAKQAVDVILIPSAFTVPTGKAHWHTLVRARAIESQAYVVAAAQGGSHRGRRETFGHSLVVDPWGEIVLELTENPSLGIVTLEKSKIQKVRTQIPMVNHRRL